MRPYGMSGHDPICHQHRTSPGGGGEGGGGGGGARNHLPGVGPAGLGAHVLHGVTRWKGRIKPMSESGSALTCIV